MALLAERQPDLAELASLSRQFESARPEEVIAWAFDRFGDGCVYTCSFENAVMIDLISKVAPSMQVVLLDTGYLFAETLWFADEVRRRYDVNLEVVRPIGVGNDSRWQYDTDGCCSVRKVEPLQRALAGKTAWLSGLRRSDGPSRANTSILSWDLGRELVKVNPLATWDDARFDAYVVANGVPANPLTERGYPSIGCWPCTQPVAPGDDPRSGRWAGSAKTECGLHFPS